jgi:phosphate uptake regulator
LAYYEDVMGFFERLLGPGPRSSLIEAAFADLGAMLQQSAQMLDLAVAALLENQPLEVDLDQMDDSVDEGERMVRRSVLAHLSFNPRTDLVPSLLLVGLVQDAERIGDFAQGLAELVPLARSPREGPFAERLRAVVEKIRPLFGICEEAFRSDDTEKGREVMSRNVEIKAELVAFRDEVANSDLTPDMVVVYTVAGRNLRRIAAHLSNIASSVVQPYDKIRHGDEDV